MTNKTGVRLFVSKSGNLMALFGIQRKLIHIILFYKSFGLFWG